MNIPDMNSSKFDLYHRELMQRYGVISSAIYAGMSTTQMEEAMRRTILATAATLALIAAGSLAPGRVEAMALSTPAGIQAAIDDTSLAQDVAYVCNRVWRCGPYGCGWRRACYWTGGYGYGWRGRHWRGRRW